MKTVKIITFPIRLVLFLAIALISGAILLVDKTICMILAIASYVVRVIGLILMIPFAVMSTIMPFTNSESYKEIIGDDPVIIYVLMVVIQWLLILFLAFLPKIAEKLYIWLYVGGIWLWNFAKTILFCRKYSRAEQEDIEILEDDEQCAVFVEEEKKYSLSELREMAKVFGQLNQSQSPNNGVTDVNSDVQENAKEIEIDDIEIW